MNVAALLDEAASRFEGRVALSVNGQPVSFGALARLTRGGGAVLAGTGAGHVVYLGVGGPGFAVAMMSAVRAGIPFTPLNYRLAPEQRSELVARFDDPVVLADASYVDALAGFRVISVDELVAQAEATHADAAPADVAQAGAAPADVAQAGAAPADVAQAGAAPAAGAEGEARLPAIDPDAVAVVLFTSGTTARPKAVLLRHSTLTPYMVRVGAAIEAGPGETTLVTVPPYHVMGVSAVLNGNYVGRRMVFLPTFTPEGWLRLAREEEVTSASLVPTMMARLVRHLDGRPGDVPSLRFLSYGGSRMPRSVLERALRAFPEVAFVHGYGLTETNAGITALQPEEHREALDSTDPVISARLVSAGKAVAGVDLQIRGPDGSVLGPFEPGELWVRGPQVAGEYAGAGSVLDSEGWFPTRDLAHLDAEGYLFVHGRTDDTIIRGGENIAPAEIEDVLDRHPSVHAVAVVGLPDEEWGERVAAVVVARPGTTAAELAAFVRERLRGSRTPDEIIFRDELPYTDTGKVQRRALVAQLLTGTTSMV